LTVNGIGKGLVEAGWADIHAIAGFLSNIKENVTGLQQLLKQEGVLNLIGEAVAKDIKVKLDTIEAALREGGDHNAELVGETIGGVLWQIGEVVAGAGAAKIGVGGNAELAKLGLKFGKNGPPQIPEKPIGNLPSNSVPPKPGQGGGADMVDDSIFLYSEHEITPSKGTLSGFPENPKKNAGADNVRAINRQNESGVILSEHGMNIEYLPDGKVKNVTYPDLRINGEVADVYSPSGNSVLTIHSKISEKVGSQAPNIVLNLTDSKLTASEVSQFIQRTPVDGLKSLILIKDGKVTVIKK